MSVSEQMRVDFRINGKTSFESLDKYPEITTAIAKDDSNTLSQLLSASKHLKDILDAEDLSGGDVLHICAALNAPKCAE